MKLPLSPMVELRLSSADTFFLGPSEDDVLPTALPDWATGKTFLYMEGRRLQRMAWGNRMKQDPFHTAVEILAFLGLLVLIQVLPRGSIPGGLKDILLAIPIFFTVFLIFHSLWQSWRTIHSNPILHWCKTWSILLVLWVVWCRLTGDAIEPASKSVLQCPFHFSSCLPGEFVVWIIFPVLILVTWINWVVFRYIYPRTNAFRCCQKRSVRHSKTRPGWMSYTPFACCSNRHHYICKIKDHEGSAQSCIWAGDSLYSETLRGMFIDEIPSPPFISFLKNGAVSRGLQVGLATARAEFGGGSRRDLERTFWCPKRRDEGLVYDIVDVECSVAGAFHAHLPQVLPRDTSRCSTSDLTLVLQRMAKSFSIQDPNGPPMSWRGTTDTSQSQELEALEAGPLEAVVLIPGFNCSIAESCTRFGQLLALTNIDSHLIPFVFSWSNGQGLSYFQALSQLPEVAADLPDFLAALKSAGVATVHLIAHSMGCLIISEVLKPALVEMQSRLPNIATLSLVNACLEPDQLTKEDLPVLLRSFPDLRVTLYCDQEDYALKIAERVHQCLKFKPYKFIGCRPYPLGRHYDDWQSRVDVIDCTTMDANAHGLRHGYYILNPLVVQDIRQFLCTERKTALSRQLMPVRGNVYTFIAPPSHVSL